MMTEAMTAEEAASHEKWIAEYTAFQEADISEIHRLSFIGGQAAPAALEEKFSQIRQIANEAFEAYMMDAMSPEDTILSREISELIRRSDLAVTGMDNIEIGVLAGKICARAMNTASAASEE